MRYKFVVAPKIIWYHIKTKKSELWERKLKNICYLLSLFRLKYIKMKFNFFNRQKLKMVVCSTLQTISMESGVSGNLVCNVWLWPLCLNPFTLELLVRYPFFTSPLPFWLPPIGRLQCPQAFPTTLISLLSIKSVEILTWFPCCRVSL